MSALDDYKTLMLDSDWYPPRPSALRGFRDLLVDRLTTPLSVAAVASLGRFLMQDPITVPQVATRYAEALLRQMQGDLRHATLYHADEHVSALVAQQSNRTDPLVLVPDMIPARNGLVVYAWPCAFTRSAELRLDLVAISWAPSRNQSFPDGGVDVTFWAAPTRYVRRHLHSVAAEAGFGGALLTRSGWQRRLGPLVLVNQWAWGYGKRQPSVKDLRGYLHAAQATFLATTTVMQVRVEPLRSRWLEFLRPGRLGADTEAYRLRSVAGGGQPSSPPAGRKPAV